MNLWITITSASKNLGWSLVLEPGEVLRRHSRFPQRYFSRPVLMAQQVNHSYEFGRFRLKPAERVLLREGEPVPLTPKVFDILVTLVEHGGQVVAKDDLMKRVWPNTFVEEGNLTQNISLLRKALGETPGGVQFIETVPRRGYRFVAETHSSSDDLAALSADVTRPTSAPPVSLHNTSRQLAGIR